MIHFFLISFFIYSFIHLFILFHNLSQEEAIHNKFSKALSNFSSSSFSSPPANSPLQNLFTPLNEGGEGGTRGKGSGLMRVKKREMLQRALFSEEIFEDNEELRFKIF